MVEEMKKPVTYAYPPWYGENAEEEEGEEEEEEEEAVVILAAVEL